jgi:hypothetical protein
MGDPAPRSRPIWLVQVRQQAAAKNGVECGLGGVKRATEILNATGIQAANDNYAVPAA